MFIVHRVIFLFRNMKPVIFNTVCSIKHRMVNKSNRCSSNDRYQLKVVNTYSVDTRACVTSCGQPIHIRL